MSLWHWLQTPHTYLREVITYLPLAVDTIEPPISGIWLGELRPDTCGISDIADCAVCGSALLLAFTVLGTDTVRVILDAMLEGRIE